MKLIFQNIARFYEQAELDFNGITVIAGENGTGKSTVGKILFCVFDSMYNLSKQIAQERFSSVSNRVGFQYSNYWDRLQMPDASKIQEIISWDRNTITHDEVCTRTKQLFGDLVEVGDPKFDEFCRDIYKIITVSDEQIKNRLLNERFLAEFNSQIKNVNYDDEEAHILLKLRDEVASISIEDTAKYESTADILKKVVYIDDLSALNMESSSFLGRLWNVRLNHSQKLGKLLLQDDAGKNVTLIDDIINKDKYQQLVEKMDSVGIGVITQNQAGDYEYKTKEFKKAIAMTNLSSGTKIFALLRKLIESASLEENGVLILDEPEIHLHPEWQAVLAELIVLMQVKLDMTILISTHSADFITFIDLYSKKYNISEKTNYYLLSQQHNNGTSVIRDVSGSIDEIYKMLGTPFIKATEELINEEH